MRVKICGITRVDDMRGACQAGADFIGVNFFPGSSRYVGSLEAARKLLAALEPPAIPVAVTVNPTREQIDELVRIGFRVIQLHGDEPGAISDHAVNVGAKVIKAFRADGPGFAQPIGDWMETVKRPDGVLAALADAPGPDPAQFGGSGRAFDWQWLANARDRGWLASLPPIMLAGGLNPRNVAKAVEVARPWGVDVAGGVEVEDSPGIKSIDKIRNFIRNARVGARKG